MIKHNLRDLAANVERVAREHPAWSQAHEIIRVTTNHLNAVARVAEINQDDARPQQLLEFAYENYRGLVALRRVNPISIRWGRSDWYPEPQWLLTCWDLDRQDRREFAIAKMADIRQVDR